MSSASKRSSQGRRPSCLATVPDSGPLQSDRQAFANLEHDMQAISLDAPRPSPEFRFGLAKQERRNSRLRLIVLGPWNNGTGSHATVIVPEAAGR